MPHDGRAEAPMVQITVEKKSGQVARLRIKAADDVSIKLPVKRQAVPA